MAYFFVQFLPIQIVTVLNFSYIISKSPCLYIAIFIITSLSTFVIQHLKAHQ